MTDDKKNTVNGVPIPRAAKEADARYNKATDFEASTYDERLQKMLDKNADLEAQLDRQVNGSESHRIIAEQLGQAEEESYQYSLKVDKNLTNKAKKVYSRSFETLSKVNNITRRATTMSGQQDFISQAKRSEELYLPTSTIENRIQESINKSSEISYGLAEKVRGLKPGDTTEHITSAAEGITLADKETARLMALKNEQNRAGLSTKKIYNRSEELLGSYNKFMDIETLNQDVSEGKYGSRKEEISKWRSAAGAVQSAATDLEKAPKNNLEEFNKKLIEATKALEKQEEVVKRVSEKEDRRASNIASVGGAIQNIATSAMVVGVDQPIQETNYRTAFANTGNRIWDRSKQAVQGYNLDAAEEILGSARIKAQVESTKTAARIIKPIGDLAGFTAETAVGVNKVAKLDVAQGGVDIASAASTGAIAAGDMLRGLTPAEKSLNRYNAELGLNEAERHMRVSQTQDFMNHGMNTYALTRGAGSTSDIQNTLMNTSNVSAFAAKGISAQEAAAAGGMLSSQAGFMEVGAANKIIGRSGDAARRGQMGQEEYVSAAARMVAAGGSADDLESIISAATTKGMDNSKNISQMVDATLSMSSGLAAQGIGATGVVSDMLGARTQSLVDSGYDKNLAIGKAQRGMEAFDAAATDKRLSFGSIIEQQAIRGIGSMKGATQAQVEQIQELTSPEMAVIRKGGKAGHLLAKERGLESKFYKENGELDLNAWENVRDIKINKVLQTGGKGSIQYSDAIMEKLKSGKSFTEEESASIRTQGGLTEEAIRSQYKGETPVNTKAKEKEDPAFDLKKGAADQMARNIAVGEKVAGGMKGLSLIMEGVIKAVKPETFGKEIQNAAKDFLPASANVLEATKNLNKSVIDLIRLQEKNLQLMGKETGTAPTPMHRNKNSNKSFRGEKGASGNW